MSKHKFLFKLLVFIAIFFIAIANNVKAAEEKEDTKIKCLICSGDPEIYSMEQQFAQRVKLFKKIPGIGNSIDEIALAATVLHKESALQAIESRYDENFKASEYQASLKTLYEKKELTDSSNANGNKEIGTGSGVSAGQVDLLNAAAIIMADSAGWGGSYNEEKYKEALAGDKLIGNNTDNAFANEVFCVAGAIADGTFTAGNVIYQFATGQDVLTEIDRTSTRWHNMSKICKYGYVGGIYDITPENYPNDEIRQLKKDTIAQEIIDLIHYYKDLVGHKDDTCAVTTTGNFATWKQYDSSWKSVAMGNDNVGNAGCLITSVAIQMARSGTLIANLPSGYDSFNPGALASTVDSHGGFTSGGGFKWTGYQSIAGNWKMGITKSTTISNNALLAKTLDKELSEAAEGKYQKFIVLQIHHNGSSQHWVAVDSVSGNNVTIFDPGASGTTLDENYSGWVVDGYVVMYATDVEFGKTGTSTNISGDNCGGDVQQMIEFIGRFEGHGLCNYHGQGEGTGYSAGYGNGESWPTAGYGATSWVAPFINSHGYPEFGTDVYTPCVSKEKLDKVLPALIDELFGDMVDQSAQKHGLNLSINERYALISVAYGGSNNHDNIMAAVEKYGKESEEVLTAFKNAFGRRDLCNGLLRRRLSEYELFMTGNYKADAADYIGYNGCSKGMALTTTEIKSYWPSGQ